MESQQTATVNEHYRYATEGRRAIKTHRIPGGTVTSQQQVRYLPGLEIRLTRTGERETLRLLVSETGKARINREVTSRRTSGLPVRFSLSDRTGSMVTELDADGKLISSETFYPFGGTAVCEGNSAYKTRRYSGKERDVTGLVYYGWRYYAPWLMRWVNTDPAGTVDGENLYRMCRNNPLTLSDTDGRISFEDAFLLYQQAHIADSDSNYIEGEDDDILMSAFLEHLDEGHPRHGEILAILGINSEAEIEHVPYYSSGRRLECTEPGCNFKASRPYLLDDHMNKHTRNKKWVCDETDCNAKFYTRHLLRQHKTFHGPRNFPCNYMNCGALFHTKHDKERHYLTHFRRKAFVCEQCNKGFKTPDGLRDHKNTHTDVKNFSCEWEGCDKAYKSQGKLARHIKMVHLQEHTQYPCSEPGCSASFQNKNALKLHNNIHTGLKPYSCRLCGTKFATPSNRNRHQRNCR